MSKLMERYEREKLEKLESKKKITVSDIFTTFLYAITCLLMVIIAFLILEFTNNLKKGQKYNFSSQDSKSESI